MRVVAFVPDLLFGSQVVGALRSAGHEVALAGSAAALAGESAGADVIVLDLTSDAEQRLAFLEEANRGGARTLAFYSHVEVDVRRAAEAAGIDRVVPRSRMAREGAALVEALAGAEA